MPSREEFFAALGSLPAAIALLTALRWPQGITCPHCGSATVDGHGRYDRCRDLPRYRCKACRRTFMLTTGTPPARSRLPLPDWVIIAWLIVLGLPAWFARRETRGFGPKAACSAFTITRRGFVQSPARYAKLPHCRALDVLDA